MNYSTLISVSYSFSLANIVVSSLHAAHYKRDLSTLRGKMLCCFINKIDVIVLLSNAQRYLFQVISEQNIRGFVIIILSRFSSIISMYLIAIYAKCL